MLKPTVNLDTATVLEDLSREECIMLAAEHAEAARFVLNADTDRVGVNGSPSIAQAHAATAQAYAAVAALLPADTSDDDEETTDVWRKLP